MWALGVTDAQADAESPGPRFVTSGPNLSSPDRGRPVEPTGSAETFPSSIVTLQALFHPHFSECLHLT